MSRRYRPTVPDGQLPAEIEDSIWTAASALPFLRAQPLTGWLLSSLWHWGDERWLSNQMSQALSIPHRSWEKGAPKRRSTLLRSVESLSKNLEQRMAELTPESAARRARALERTVAVLKVDLAATPCTMFHHTFGVGGGDELEALAVKVDKVSAAILENPGLRGQAAEMVVRAAETTGVIQDGAILALPEMDPGLDAVLLLMARLDRDWAVDLWANDTTISSVFALLVDMPGSAGRKRPTHRLLDIYYCLAFGAKYRRLPKGKPSIDQLETTLLDSLPESGARSPIIRWRNGLTLLRYDQVEKMVALVLQRHGQDLDKHFRVLWTAAQLWDLVELGGPEATRIAGARYRQWWDAMESEGRAAAPLAHPYWVHFQPHA